MKSRYVFIIITAFFMVMLIIYPEKYIPSVANGLNLYALNVLPALFPFLFFSKILGELNFGYDLGKAMNKPIKKLYNVSGIGGYVLVMAMLSGYPLGAKALSDLYEKKYISSAEARSISTFTSSSGPLFIVGTVGIIMLSNKLAGFVILISHYLGTILNGLLYRRKNTKESKQPILLTPLIDSTKVMSDSITSSIISVAIVGGYIAIFNMALDVITDFNIISLFAKLFSFTTLDYNLGVGFFSSIIEITKGCLIMSKSGISIKIIVPLCTFAITFGGLSITLQSMTFLAKCKIKPAFYLLSKFTQAIISTVISLPLCLIL
jgi:sporulation integral membrane protein YlbJ